MKKMCALLLILSLLLPGAAGTAEETKFEGDGYGSPEEAVLAYLEAMNQADVRQMLSTFAMETFVDRADTRLFVEYLRGADPTQIYSVPVTGAYSRSLLLAARYGSIATELKQQYIEYNAELSQSPSRAILVSTPETMQAYEDCFASSPMQGLAGHVEFVEWINPALLTEGSILKPSRKASNAVRTAYYGADDIAEMAAHIRINGMDGLQCMQCVKYGERWYNASLGGEAGMSIIAKFVMSLDHQALMLAKTTEEANQFRNNFQANDHAEECAQWDALRGSSLAGTRWQLTEVNAPGVAVREDGALAESAEGLSVYAELRFYSTGSALILLRGSRALQEQLGMQWGNAVIGLAWREENGKLEIEQIKAMNKQHVSMDLTLDAVSLKQPTFPFGRDTLTLAFADGLTAVFEKQ